MSNEDFRFHGRNPDGTEDTASRKIDLGISRLNSILKTARDTAKVMGDSIRQEINRGDKIAEVAADQNLPPFMRNRSTAGNTAERVDPQTDVGRSNSSEANHDDIIRRLNEKVTQLASEAGLDQNKRIEKVPADKVVPIVAAVKTDIKTDAKAEVQPEEKFKLTAETKKKIRELPQNIKSKIYGQDDVIDDVVGILKTAFAGLSSNKKKPKGAYMFAGPSGCGKTETVMQVAEFMGIPVKKFSMTEFSEENDVKKLIGSPPGYIGYEDGGQLTNFVMENPNGIVLFDEIEKADPSISKILLGMLEDGKLTDNKGKDAVFTNTMFFATSNLGSEIEYVKNVSKEDKDEYRMNAIKDFFPIEVINRFDSMIQFSAISQEVYAKIAEKVLKSLVKDFSETHEIEFSYDKEILDFVVSNSYDPAMGGRPVGRFMAKVLIAGIVEKMFDESDSLEGVKSIKLSINDKSNLVFKGSDDSIIAEVENTQDLVARYKKNRLTKEEKETAQKAEQIAPTPPENAPAVEPISLKIESTRKSRAQKNTEIAAADPIVAKANAERIKRKNSPRKS